MRKGKIAASIAAIALAACAASPGAGADAAEANAGDVAVKPGSAKQSPRDDGLTQNQIDVIVAEIMDQQYGNTRNAIGQCWEYTYSDQDVEADYCMQPAKAEVVKTPGGYGIYLRASSKPDTGDGYEAITPGLMGAFQVSIDRNGKWRYVAKSRALPFGTMGYCGCDKAKFVRLGNEYYGWMFTSGGSWQGVAVANHEIVAPHGDAFTDISEVQEIREDNQDASYSVEVVADSGDIFPLKVTKTVSGHLDGERMVQFDKSRWTYRMPEMF